MAARKLLITPSWKPFEISCIIQEHIDCWQAFCKHRCQLQEGAAQSILKRDELYRSTLESN